jgi:hypothetical protein
LSTARVSRCWGAEQPWHAALEGERCRELCTGEVKAAIATVDATSEGMHSATGGSAGCAGPRRNV